MSPKEAEDVDFIQTGDDTYFFAYCDEHDIYLKEISKETNEEEPECIYITPATRGSEKPSTPKFRAMRFLTKEFLIMLTNIHSNGGVVLQIFRIPPGGKGQCRLAQSHRLPDRITKATGLAVANLTPPTSPSEPQGYTQFVVAVAGHDISLSLFKIDLQSVGSLSVITGIKPFRSFRNVHPLQITSLAFSNFTPPTHPITADTPPQYLKLASVGVSNTVVVHTFPLFPVPLSMKRGQSTTPRYVIALPSTAAAIGVGITLSVIAIAFAAVLIQGILEIRGGVPEYLNARNRLPVVWQEALGRPFEFPSGYNSISTTTSATFTSVPTAEATPSPKKQSKPKSSAKSDSSQKTPGQKVNNPEEGYDFEVPEGHPELETQDKLVRALKNTGSSHGRETPGHLPKQGEKQREWHELEEHEKESWIQTLKDGGQWVEGQAEEIFKGVLFGEMAGQVGAAVRG